MRNVKSIMNWVPLCRWAIALINMDTSIFTLTYILVEIFMHFPQVCAVLLYTTCWVYSQK
ncbi:hypothetical protein BDF14DRAFT_1760930 [Spinellus fusiger]|nr:hypothetical protein BDF14DRAFT_1760930 [Spinellus fusiger]